MQREETTHMLRRSMDEDVEVMVRLGLQEPLHHMFMLFRCVTDMDLPAVGPYELSKASAVVAMEPKMVVGSRRSTVRIAVSVAGS
jgi:hypothetical protein